MSENKKRGERRRRTEVYGTNARDVHLRWIHPNGNIDCICEKSIWFFAKGKSVGCRCRRNSRQCGPKVPGSLCHCNRANGGYHPATRERIDGNRAAKRWLLEARSRRDLDDVEL